MRKLSNFELENVKGGIALSTAIAIGVGISAVIVFISGVISGITNPEECSG